jgi:hypothetical protein
MRYKAKILQIRTIYKFAFAALKENLPHYEIPLRAGVAECERQRDLPRCSMHAAGQQKRCRYQKQQ